MAEYLTAPEVDAVTDVVSAEVAIDPQLRPLLFDRVHRGFLATLPYNAKPGSQVFSDVTRMNGVERLVDGSVPLQQWLANAARHVQDAAQRAVLESALDRVAAAASGEPALDDAVAVAESQEKAIFRDDTVPFDFLAGGAAAGRSVGRIVVPPWSGGAPVLNPAGEPEPHAGTCWLISPDVVVTNHHVVNARSALEGPAPRASDADLSDQAAHAVVRFDYDTEQSAGQEISGSTLLAASPELDYALVRLAAAPGRAPLPLYVERLTATQADNVAVNVIQHPGGQPKRVGLRNNLVSDTTPTDVRYFTDTRTGSSGSPVLTDGWQVCALHRGSRRVDVQFQGKPSAFVNVGTQVRAILDDLAARHPDVLAAVTGLAAPVAAE
jgi:endonuclease G, mitochondrial